MTDRELSVHQEHELLQKLEKAGLGPADAQAIIDSRGNVLAMKLLLALRKPNLIQVVSQERAQEIMGSNFFSPALVAKSIKILVGDKFFDELMVVPFSEEDLLSRSKDFVLVPCFGISAHELIIGYEKIFYKRGWTDDNSRHNGAWEAKMRAPIVAKEKPGWHLIHKGVYPLSRGKSADKQLEMVQAAGLAVPSIRTMMFVLLLQILDQNDWWVVEERPIHDYDFGRCSDKHFDSPLAVGINRKTEEGHNIDLWSCLSAEDSFTQKVGIFAEVPSRT